MKLMDDSKKPDGFTLVEILMALFIGLLLLGAVYVAMLSGLRSSASVERKVAAQQDVRAALDIMAAEVSMASFNSNFIPAGIWRLPPNATPNPCSGSSLNQTWKGIQEATPTSITVQMDTGKSGAVGDNAGEIIRYAYDTANQYITRITNDPATGNCAPAQDFLGNISTAAAGTRTVRVINWDLGVRNGNGTGGAIFRYYNGQDTEVYPDIDSAQIPNIRRIDITLAIETEEMDAGTGQRRRMIYSTSTLVRNHAIN